MIAKRFITGVGLMLDPMLRFLENCLLSFSNSVVDTFNIFNQLKFRRNVPVIP
jgi:hypothetical protein